LTVLTADAQTWFQTVLVDFDLETLCELALNQNFDIPLARVGVNLIGVLMSLDDHLQVQAYEKMKLKTHRHLMSIVDLEQHAIQPQKKGLEDEKVQDEVDKHKVVLKEALWALSNLAAGPPYMLDNILSDTTLETCIKLAQTTRYQDIFTETMFFLTNLISNATKSHFLTRLLDRDLLVLLIKALSSSSSKRLLTNSMEALGAFFRYDRAQALKEEGSSIRDYFEAAGGVEALSRCQMHMNGDVQEMAGEMLTLLFHNEDEGLQDSIFSQ